MQAQKMVTAEAMARAVQFDPQFALPARPRFPREFVVVPLADGLLVEGTDEQQVLRGQATRTLLPRLIPQLDGEHTHNQLVAAMPDVPVGHLQQAVALLYTRGLLEDASDDPQAGEAQFNSQTLAFLRRNVDATRVNRSAWQAAQRLMKAEVIVYATGGEDSRADVAEQLREAGVGTVAHDDLDGTMAFSAQPGGKLAVVLVEGTDDAEKLAQLDARCARLGVPWLRVAVNPAAQTADLGPYFERGETACYNCFCHANELTLGGDEAVVAPEDAALHARLWAGMLVAEAVSLLSRITPAATGLSVKRYDLNNWSLRSLHFPRLPGCPNCRPAEGAEVGIVSTAVVYEDSVRFPSRHLVDPKNHQVHYRASNIDLAQEGKRYPSLEKVALPDRAELVQLTGSTLDHLPGSATGAPKAARLGLKELASLLLFGAGIQQDEVQRPVKSVKPKRWAATGGNLGSAEFYVVAHNVAGLEPGLYFYQSNEHVLARLNRGWGREEAAAFIRQAIDGASEEMPDALIIAAAALHRVAQKYASFAYRITNLDAGVALAQVRMVGSSLGLRTRLAQRWADDLIAERLGLLDLGEPVTGAMLIYGPQEKE
jgi:SagB-type dehydrogenase family enzyme